jgi:hypothetical protein
MCLLVLPLVQPHAPARLYERSLYRRVRVLQSVPEGGVLRVREPMCSISLQCRELPDQRREVAGRAPGTPFGPRGPIYEPNILPRTVAIPLPGRCQRVTHAT